MLNKKANPLLVKTEQAIRAKVAPEQTKAFEKIISAGLKVLDSEKTHKLVASQLQAQGDPAEIAGAGAAKILGVLMNQSKGSMPMKAGIPAATVLLLEALDRLEELGRIEVTNETLAEATQAMGSAILQMMDVTPQKLDMLTKKAQQPQPAQQAEQPPQTPPPGGVPASGPQPLIGAPQ